MFHLLPYGVGVGGNLPQTGLASAGINAELGILNYTFTLLWLRQVKPSVESILLVEIPLWSPEKCYMSLCSVFSEIQPAQRHASNHAGSLET